MVLLGKIMILQGVGHPISCLGVCYANDPKKGGYTTPAPALDLTTSLRGDFRIALKGSMLVAYSKVAQCPCGMLPHFRLLDLTGGQRGDASASCWCVC